MEHLTQIELNDDWQIAVAKISDQGERDRLALIKLSHAQCNALKLMYGHLCDRMNATMSNDVGEAWPRQKILAKELGWSERTVRTYKSMLEVLGYLRTHRTKRPSSQCLTQNHYELMPPELARTGYQEVPTGKLLAATNRQAACRIRTNSRTNR